MLERRTSQRRRTYIGGRVVFNNRSCTVDCLVKNLSPTGAKITFSDGIAIPSDFDLIMTDRGHSRRAQIAWRNEREAGLTFGSSGGAEIVSIETMQRIRRLEDERAALRARISKLSEP